MCGRAPPQDFAAQLRKPALASAGSTGQSFVVVPFLRTFAYCSKLLERSCSRRLNWPGYDALRLEVELD